MSHPDVIVVGGGIIGAACTHALSRSPLSVMMLDHGSLRGQATDAAGGLLAPLIEVRPNDPLSALSTRARDLYPELAGQLADDTGIDIGLWMEGILQLAYTEDDAVRLKNEIAWQRQQGFNADWLSEEDLRGRAPGVNAEALGALIAPEDGVVEPVALRRALIESAKQRGVTVREGIEVRAVATRKSRICGVETAAGRIDCEHAILAAGAWSGRLAGLPRPLSIEPIRGQMAALDWPSDEPPNIIYGEKAYVLHRNGEAWVGSTMEHVGFDASTTE